MDLYFSLPAAGANIFYTFTLVSVVLSVLCGLLTGVSASEVLLP